MSAETIQRNPNIFVKLLHMHNRYHYKRKLTTIL